MKQIEKKGIKLFDYHLQKGIQNSQRESLFFLRTNRWRTSNLFKSNPSKVMKLSVILPICLGTVMLFGKWLQWQVRQFCKLVQSGFQSLIILQMLQFIVCKQTVHVVQIIQLMFDKKKKKFGALYRKKQIPEWKQAYLDYPILKEILRTHKLVLKHAVMIDMREVVNEKMGFSISNINQEILKSLNNNIEVFKFVFQAQFKKVNKFFEYKMYEISQKWVMLKLNSQMLLRNFDKNKKKQLKEQYLRFYYEIILLLQYAGSYQRAVSHIVRKIKEHNKECEYFGIPKIQIRRKREVQNSYINTNIFRLLNLKRDSERYFVEYFLYVERNTNRKHLEKKLNNIAKNKQMGLKESYILGMSLGMAAIIMLICIQICIESQLSINNDSQLQQAFPVFRGVALIIFYYWCQAFNVYVWNKFNINYKEVLNFNGHYSKINQIIKRCSFFTALWIIIFLIYIMMIKKIDIIGYKVSQHLPILIWLVIFFYIFFPSSKHMNGQGRAFLFRKLKHILLFCKYKTNFCSLYIIDQITSFVITLKDLDYTICYYKNGVNHDSYIYCRYSNRFSFVFLAASLPFIFRLIHTIRTINSSNIISGLVNIVKLSFAIIVIFLQYLYSQNSDAYGIYFYCWVVSSFITFMLMYPWDLYMDWQLWRSQKKGRRFLRNQLAYNSTGFYYFAMIINFIFRLTFIINISPNLTTKITSVVNIQVVNLCVGLTEIIRRSLWNFFRIEVEHLMLIGDFRALQSYNFPFNDIQINNIDKLIYLQYQQLGDRNQDIFNMFLNKNETNIGGDDTINNIVDSSQNIRLNLSRSNSNISVGSNINPNRSGSYSKDRPSFSSMQSSSKDNTQRISISQQLGQNKQPFLQRIKQRISQRVNFQSTSSYSSYYNLEHVQDEMDIISEQQQFFIYPNLNEKKHDFLQMCKLSYHSSQIIQQQYSIRNNFIDKFTEGLQIVQKV